MVITSMTSTPIPNLVQIYPMEACEQMGYNINYIYLFIIPIIFGNSPTGQTTFNGSNNADARKDVPFGISSILHPI